MKKNLETDSVARKYSRGEAMAVDEESDVALDFSTVFKQLFCIAAQNLANLIHEPLEKLGVLFEEPLETGTMNQTKSSKRMVVTRQPSSVLTKPDVEKDHVDEPFFGRGQYLSVMRRLSPGDVDRFAAHGYRFATISSIVEPMAKTMQVPQSWMHQRLEHIWTSASSENLLPPGVHLASFVLRPSMHKSFDVLVSTARQNQLLVSTLALPTLSQWQAQALQKFENWTIAAILKELIYASRSVKLEQDFRWQLYRAFSQLAELVGDPSFMSQAKFSAKPIHAPCQSPPGSTGSTTCTLLSVRSMQTIHAQAPNPELTYVPFSFFSAQQQMYSGPASHENFARQAKAEFAHCLADSPTGKRAPTRIRSWADFKLAHSHSAPPPPTVPSSIYRPSLQRPSSDRLSIESKSPIVMEDGGSQWVEMMEKRRRNDKDADPASIAVSLADASEDEESSGYAYMAAFPVTGEDGSTMPPRRTQDDLIIRVDMVKPGSEPEPAEMDTYVNELFALFKLSVR
jgi:hypothetical protein